MLRSGDDRKRPPRLCPLAVDEQIRFCYSKRSYAILRARVQHYNTAGPDGISHARNGSCTVDGDFRARWRTAGQYERPEWF